jgi:hypothetical protein
LEVEGDMTKPRIAVLAVIVAVLAGSAAFAAEWNGLTVGNQYSLSISEFGSGSGNIKQFDGVDMTHSIAVSSGVLYSLPRITVAQATEPTFWGVCIDTREWSTNPEDATLKEGWTAGTAPLTTAGRDNGTVLDQDAWNHTTYLFSQYSSAIGAMSNQAKSALQLAIWEVMSGDGSASGGDWTAGNFRATNVTGTVLTEANAYVEAAYIGFADNWSSTLGDEAVYFSGVFDQNGQCYRQDYLVYAPAPVPNIPVVPEIPATILGPLGLVALGALRRKLA